MSLTDQLYFDTISGFPGFRMIKELNSGYFGRVYEAEEIASGDRWACKIIEVQKLTPKQRKNVLTEAAIMRRVSHENIVALKEFVQTKTHYILVMELMKGGDLFERLEAQTTFLEEDARQLIEQVARAIKYLHDNGIAHRDLKIENLMFLEKGSNILKLGDFGLAKEMNGLPAKTPCGTPEYMAPEVVNGDLYSPSVDIWALGCLVFILLYGTFPFYNDEDSRGNRLVDVTEKIKKGEYTFPLEGQYQNETVSENAKDIIRKSLQTDPLKRLTIDQFLQHDWIRTISTNLYPLITPAALRTANGLVSMKDYFTVGVTLQRDDVEDGKKLQEDLLEQKNRSVLLTSMEGSELFDRRKRKKRHHQENSSNNQKKARKLDQHEEGQQAS